MARYINLTCSDLFYILGESFIKSISMKTTNHSNNQLVRRDYAYDYDIHEAINMRGHTRYDYFHMADEMAEICPGIQLSPAEEAYWTGVHDPITFRQSRIFAETNDWERGMLTSWACHIINAHQGYHNPDFRKYVTREMWYQMYHEYRDHVRTMNS